MQDRVPFHILTVLNRLRYAVHDHFVPAQNWRRTLAGFLCGLFLITLPFGALAQGADVKEIKKEADRRFDEEDYDGAYKLYSQLVANFPKDPVFNYRLGVCMIFSEPDKKKALPYLKNAAASEEAPPESFFFLGKAYHVNYRFDEAIASYTKFREIASEKLQKKMQVSREIDACMHGKQLLSNLTDLVVQNKKSLNEADYFRSYDLRDIGGKLLVKPDEFRTSLDKKKKDRSIVFLPKNSDVVYFSSYGKDGQNGKDLYYAVRQPGGFSDPQPVNGVNTPYDEDYPFLHPDGKTLYFASKGHNSMGGYDIFRSTFQEQSNSWSAPVNLEFPINSPDDDFLFVTDSLQQVAFFSTGRQSPPGKIDVLRIKTERKPIDVVVIAGTVEPETENQSVESTFTIKDLTTGKNISVISAEPNGSYLMEVPNASKLLFTVATPGLTTQSQEVSIPLAKTSATFKQTITYKNGKLRIINDFDPQPTEDNYKNYLAVIEKKAQLEVNEGENKIEALTQDTGTGSGEPGETTKPTVVEEEPATTAVDNRELAKMARQDAEQSQQEAQQLERDAAEARKAGEEQKASADQRLSEAAAALESAQSVGDPEERETKTAEAEKMLADAKNDQLIAGKVLDLATTLENDADNRRKEAELNKQYADELDKVVVSGNPQSLKKLETLRQEIEAVTGARKTSEDRVADIRRNLSEKEKQAEQTEAVGAGIRAELDENAKAISAKQEELAGTRKKSKRAAISAEIDELNASRTEKEKELSENNADLQSITEEISSLETDLQLASGTKPETLAKNDEERPITAIQPSKEKVPEITSSDQPSGEIPAVPAGGITAASPREANAELARLDDQVAEDVAQDDPGSALTDAGARQLASEADAAFEDVKAARQKLRNDIAAARSAISSGNETNTAETAAGLSREAESLMAEAQKLRAEARDATGAEKDRRTAQAKEKEELATDKLIEAAQVTAQSNEQQFSTGDGNLQALLSGGKGGEEERSQAVQLNGEAELAFIQAAEIRAEAANLPTKGARLGNLSNAEEKEAEALLKQQQAIELLRKSNPDVQLAGATPPGATDVAGAVAPVNKSLAELRTAEVNAYSRAYAARERELNALTQGAENNGGPDSPEKERARQLLTEAQTIFSAAGSDPDKLKEAVQKQNEAIAAFRAAASVPEPLANVQDTGSEPVQTEPENNEPVTTETETVAATTSATTAVTETEPDVPRQQPAKQFREQEDLFTGAQARTAFSQALNDLEAAEREIKSVPGSEESVSLTEGRTRADNLRTEAESATGPDAQEKQLQAAVITQKLNEAEMAANDQALNTLLARLENDDNTRATELKQRLAAIAVTQKQATELRKEAASLDNTVQMLGGMSNADEKETEVLTAQREIVTELRSRYTDFSPAEVRTDIPVPASPPTAALEKQSSALTRLTNAFNLEFEAARTHLPAQLDEKQTATRDSALKRNSASKQMLVEAMRENDPAMRSRKLRMAANEASEGLRALARIKPGAEISGTRPVRESETAVTATVPSRPPVTPRTTTRVDGLEVIRGNAYNPNKPIPFNVPAGEGLTFRVQIGAFRTRLPEDAFRGLTPLNGETTANGFFRYTAGNFNKYENANAVKNDLRGLGYNDAFVVAYYNGKRITLAEALGILQREGRSVDPAAPQSAGITANSNVPRPSAVASALPANVEAELNRTTGLLYTIQIGVYNRLVASGQLQNLSPIFREDLGNGLFRYTAGIYNDLQKTTADKRRVVDLGIRDAFVTAYIGGKRVPVSTARDRQQNDASITAEAERPVVFPTGGAPAASAPAAEPFTNNVRSYPAASPENGIKTNEEGITFKVQIGAFSRQVPPETATRFARIKNWPVEYKTVNNLFIYNVGNFSEARFARALKDEIVAMGIDDAFVAVYRDGKKLYGQEAATLLSR